MFLANYETNPRNLGSNGRIIWTTATGESATNENLTGQLTGPQGTNIDSCYSGLVTVAKTSGEGGPIWYSSTSRRAMTIAVGDRVYMGFWMSYDGTTPLKPIASLLTYPDAFTSSWSQRAMSVAGAYTVGIGTGLVYVSLSLVATASATHVGGKVTVNGTAADQKPTVGSRWKIWGLHYYKNAPALDGRFFDGSSKPFLYLNQLVYPTWGGEENNTQSSFEYEPPQTVSTVWGASGRRRFEGGVSKGMLYVQNDEGEYQTGVPWNGLTKVSPSSSDGELTAFYMDGEKYYRQKSKSYFSLSVEAYTYPEEFESCLGKQPFGAGAYFDNQGFNGFGMSYVTQIAESSKGLYSDYRLHLVYNGLVSAESGQSFATMNSTFNPTTFSWNVDTIPDQAGNMSTAHVMLDSTLCDGAALQKLKHILYGVGNTKPRLPSLLEVYNMFSDTMTMMVTMMSDGLWTATAVSSIVNTSGNYVNINSPSAVGSPDGDTFTIASY